MVLLHGTLHIKVHEATKLVNADGLASHVSGISKTVGKLFSKVETKIGKVTGLADLSDPYVHVDLGVRRIVRTSVISNSLNPKWNEEFTVLVADNVDEIVFNVADKDLVSKAALGCVFFSTLLLLRGEPIDGWFKLVGPNRATNRDLGMLSLSMTFVPAHYAGPTANLAMPNVYFPLRQGCRVTLYNDAHQPTGLLPSIPLDSGAAYESHCCWEDVFDAIQNARHLIYITGWSVMTHITLIRDASRRPIEQTYVRLGELLVAKAQQGVRVLIMPWDDQTNLRGITAGVMGTADELTRKFFENTPVKVFLCAREGGHTSGVTDGQQVGRIIFTHHQKAMVCDAPNPYAPDSRTIIGFVGGIDLCGGRWDTANHELFSTLNSHHAEDFRQSSIPGCERENGGPRLPWHDLHSRVEGAAAFDVLSNFTNRWQQQGGTNRQQDLLNLGMIPGLHIPSAVDPNDPVGAVFQFNDPRAWSVQVLRSIDGRSVLDLKKSGPLPAVSGVNPQKGLQVEHTVHDAHVQAIRRANKFLYIESQYFLGSCHWWDSFTDCNCEHLIPVEIALKVASKIRARERFAAYILIPMFPEGDPTSEPVNEILFWQAQTIRMMYRIVVEALLQAGSQAHPQEYLNFYCLGNREGLSSQAIATMASASHASGLARKQTVKPPTAFHQQVLATRRFMVYIHSKMMIVDDEYIILGSANVNQRSMDGTRDSEIAIGAFQPANTVYSRGGRLPRGDIHGFRMQLWAEHTGVKGRSPDIYADPSTPECVNAMSSAARWNWDAYLAPQPGPLPYGHLLPYPITVGVDGSIAPDPGSAFIPDTTTSIMGKKSSTLPFDLST